MSKPREGWTRAGAAIDHRSRIARYREKSCFIAPPGRRPAGASMKASIVSRDTKLDAGWSAGLRMTPGEEKGAAVCGTLRLENIGYCFPAASRRTRGVRLPY